MKLQRVELRHVRLKLVAPFETSLGVLAVKDAVILRGEADGLVGWGEVAAWKDPWYSYETIETSLYVLQQYLIPHALRADIEEQIALDAWPAVRGYPMAKAALQTLLLDLTAQREGRSLASWLGGERPSIPVGISLGIESTIEGLVARVNAAVSEGYHRIKLKIRPGWDIDVVRAVRNAVGPDVNVGVDANGAYTLRDARHLTRLDEFNLSMIEQPLQYNDIDDHAELARRIKTPICLDESASSVEAVKRALSIGACRMINVKHARVGGPLAARHIHDICQERGLPVFCGGMLETGIGRAVNVAVASLPNFTIPGDLSASSRYFARDLISPPFELQTGGRLSVPDHPGTGVTIDEEALEHASVACHEVVA